MSEAMAISVLSSLAYSDLFRQPLTAPELYRRLWQPPAIEYADFLLHLEQLVARGLITSRQGFYWLPDSAASVATRQRRVVWNEKKLRLARRGARLLALVPFVEGVFVCNTVAAGTADRDSDIDLLIITSPKRIWLSRFLATVVLSLARLRRHGARITNRLCLSFYVTRDALDFSSVRIVLPDVYLAYWTAELLPIYDPNGLMALIQTQNTWAKAYLPHRLEQYRLVSTYAAVGPVRRFPLIGGSLERLAKTIQLSYMSARGRATGEKKGVIISDTMLKFHEQDRRADYQRAWHERLQQSMTAYARTMSKTA